MNEEKLLIEKLNDRKKENRLLALKGLKQFLVQPDNRNDVNNHIHTTYSFSPYSPTRAVYMAYISGLRTAGIMDHDSIAGAKEFIEAGRILGIETTIGVECRVDMKGTLLHNRRINNPDQTGIAYCTLHGIPHTKIDAVSSYFKPYIENRIKRNVKITENINELFRKYKISLDMDKDIINISMYHDGGTITERHILFALAKKLIKKFKSGQLLIDFLENELKTKVSDKAKSYICDPLNDVKEYDLLGVLKTDLISKIYVDADDECPDVTDYIGFAERIGAVSAYAYLGDVGQSVTGDKKAQEFEDGYIDELFVLLSHLGFNALTYMPSRNTKEQLQRVKLLCDKFGLFQISGEDINQPRQSFVCEAMRRPEFSNLISSTYALIGHEKEATININNGMFTSKTISLMPKLDDRIEYFKSKVQNGTK